MVVAVAVALAAAACNGTSGEPIEPATPSPSPSESVRTTPSPTPSDAPTGTPEPVSTADLTDEQADWDEIELAPGDEWVHAEGLLGDGSGWLAITTDDWPPESEGGHQLQVHRITGAGRADRRYGDDGSVEVTRSHGYAPIVVHEIVRHPGDAVLLITSAIDSADQGPLSVHRILPDGSPDQGWRSRFEGITLEEQGAGSIAAPRAAVLPDGSVRICFERNAHEPRVDLLGLTATGARDARVGPDGIREGVLPDGSSCEAMLPAEDGSFLIAGSGPNGQTIWSLDRSGAQATVTLEPDPSWDAGAARVSQLRRGRDGSLYLGMLIGDEAAVAKASSPDAWDRSFGDRGLAVVDDGVRRIASLDAAGDRVLVGIDPAEGGDRIVSIRSADGVRDAAFGSDGTVRLGNVTVARALVDRGTHLVVLLQQEPYPQETFLRRIPVRLGS